MYQKFKLLIEEEGAKFVSYKFLTLFNQLQEVDVNAAQCNESRYPSIGTPKWGTSFLDMNRSFPTIAVLCEPQEYDVLKSSINASTLQIGFDIEFSIFERAQYSIEQYNSYIKIEHDKNNTNIVSEIGNTLHKSGIECLMYMSQGIKHTITIAPAALDAFLDTLVLVKYIIKSVVASYGKSATFMPHPTIDQQNNLILRIYVPSKEEFIGGIMSNIRALQALTNPSVNSYYSKTRFMRICNDYIETNLCDSIANPYLAIIGLIIAGNTGKESLTSATIQMCNSFTEALYYLKHDHHFLHYPKDIIDKHIKHHNEIIDKISACITTGELYYYYNL